MQWDFINSQLTSPDADPDEWITDLESKRADLNAIKIPGKSELTDVDLMLQVFTNLPPSYEVVVDALEVKMMLTTDQLELEDVRDRLNMRYA